MSALHEPVRASLPRWTLAALAIAWLAIACAAMLQVVRPRADGDSTAQPGTTLPTLGAVVRDRAVGASLRAPSGWSVVRGHEQIALRSPDHLAVVTVAAPARARSKRALLHSADAALAARWRGARSRPAPGWRLAGRPARALVVAGPRRRALVVAVRGHRRAYLVEVLTTAGAPMRRLAEAQLTLTTLRLTH